MTIEQTPAHSTIEDDEMAAAIIAGDIARARLPELEKIAARRQKKAWQYAGDQADRESYEVEAKKARLDCDAARKAIEVAAALVAFDLEIAWQYIVEAYDPLGQKRTETGHDHTNVLMVSDAEDAHTRCRDRAKDASTRFRAVRLWFGPYVIEEYREGTCTWRRDNPHERSHV